MQRTIVHFDLDSFFVSVERLKNSKLKGLPVIIGGHSKRGVVAACSYEARAFGVHSAMPVYLAKRLCPEAVFIRGDMDEYVKYSRMVTEIIEERSPVFEKASIDEFYIDISGMDRFFGNLKWSGELRQYIMKETGLPVSTGISVNKTVSKIVTGEAKPNGLYMVQQPEVQPFLDPLSIRKIPGVGQKSYQLLHNMGVEQIATLRQIPLRLLRNVLGKNGEHIWKKANGIDNTPVLPCHEQKSTGSEHTFEHDTADTVLLKHTLERMTEKNAFILRQQNKAATTVTVKIRYSNHDTHSLQKKIPPTSFDYLLKEYVLELFDRLYTRRMMIRLAGVKFSGLINGAVQLNVFYDVSRQVNLYRAIDKIKETYGQHSVGSAAALIPPVTKSC